MIKHHNKLPPYSLQQIDPFMKINNLIRQQFNGDAAYVQEAGRALKPTTQAAIMKASGTDFHQHPRASFSDLISEMHLKSEIDDNLRHSHLEEISRQSEQTQQKLRHLSELITSLQSPQKAKGSFLTADQLRSYTERSKQFKQDQKRREGRLRKEMQDRRAQLLQEDKKAQRLKKLKQREQRTLKQLQLSKISQQSAQRRKHLEAIQETLRTKVSYKPLYVQKEQEFTRSFVLPQLQRIRNAISSKRSSFDAKGLKDHEREYLRHSKSEQDRRIRSLNVQVKQAPSQAERNAAQLFKKRLEYSKQVKTSFLPKTDSLKQKEMELIRERLKMPVRRKTYALRPKPQRVAQKKSLSMDFPVDVPRPKDYLLEQRESRRLIDAKILSSGLPRSKVSDVKLIDRIIGEKEAALRRLTADNPDVSFNTEARLTDVLISNLRTKIELLKKHM